MYELESHTLLHPQLFDSTFPCEFPQLLAVIIFPRVPLYITVEHTNFQGHFGTIGYRVIGRIITKLYFLYLQS